MASERFALLLVLVGCAHADPRVFPLAAPVTRDQDLDSVTLSCDGKPACAPSRRVSDLLWDAVDNSAFRPASQALRLRVVGEAADVNALDEVPDSSFFVNRTGPHGLSADEVFRGTCKTGKLPDTQASEWLVDHGKDDGQSAGFRVRIDDTRYMLKLDEIHGEQATAATAIASRLYYAAGFWAPCDSVVYFPRNILRIAPNLTVQGNTGSKRRLDDAEVDRELAHAPRRGALVRAVASRWLPGVTIGPFAYVGTKADDPNDVVPHEQRRAVRGSRLLAAWLGHFDAREQNTMATWLPDAPARPGRGHVQHWFIDLGDSFGLQWPMEGFSKRLNHAYFFDGAYLVEDFVTLGIPQRAWDTARVRPGVEDFGYYDVEHFDPEAWRPEYPMPPFRDMTEADGAWMARIIARFDRAQLEAAVRAGDLTSPVHSRYLVDTLVGRQHAILRRYFRTLSSLTDVEVRGAEVCAVDLALRTTTYPGSKFRFTADVQRAGAKGERTAVRTLPAATVCATLPARRADDGTTDDDASRYVVLRMRDGASRGALVVHLYDLGPRRGLQIAGIERTSR